MPDPNTPDPAPRPSQAGISTLLHAAGHFFEHIAGACRATVRALEADAAALVEAGRPSAEATAARIEAVLADDVATVAKAELPKAEAAVARVAETAVPAILSEAGQVAVKAAEAAL